jgi:hypothetical protein
MEQHPARFFSGSREDGRAAGSRVQTSQDSPPRGKGAAEEPAVVGSIPIKALVPTALVK